MKQNIYKEQIDSRITEDRKHLSKIFSLALAITTIVLFARDILDININQYIVFFITTFFFLLLPKRECLFYLGFICGLIIGLNSYTLLVGACISLYKDRRYLKKHIELIILPIVLITWELINCAFYHNGSSLLDIILYFGFILVFFYYLMDGHGSDDNKNVILFYTIGLAITMLIICLVVINDPLIFSSVGDADFRVSIGSQTNLIQNRFATNANNLGYFSIVAIALVTCLRRCVYKSSMLIILLLAISVCAGFLSGSRTWFILVIFLLFVELFFKKHLLKKLQFLVLAAVFLLIGYLLFSNFIDASLSIFLDRFTLDNLYTAGNRTELLKEYSTFMNENRQYLLGGTGAIYYIEITRCSNSCHNAFQQIYIAYGILGCLFFACVFTKSIYHKIKDSSAFNFIPVIVSLIFLQSIQLLNPFHLMIPISITALAYKINLKG